MHRFNGSELTRDPQVLPPLQSVIKLSSVNPSCVVLANSSQTWHHKADNGPKKILESQGDGVHILHWAPIE